MTQSFSVALLGSKTIGGELAKKGTSSDITLYNFTSEKLTVTYVEPTQFPEKFPPLMNSLYMGQRVVLAVDAVNRDIGEALIATDLSGKTEGIIALSEKVGKDEMMKFVKGTSLERFQVVPLDPKEIRQKVLEWPPLTPREGSVVVPIDHAFPVKGVGTVVLGFVRRGTIKVHDKLRLYPEEKSVEVKSMQVHDVDVQEAGYGSRVGLALKGVEVEEVSRGHVLAMPEGMRVGDIVELHDYAPCKFFKGKAGEGEKVHLSVGLHVVPAKISTVDGPRITLQTASPVAWIPEEKGFVIQLSGANVGPRVAGSGTLA
jgi:selenocysteine-specific translation elongation factor